MRARTHTQTQWACSLSLLRNGLHRLHKYPHYPIIHITSPYQRQGVEGIVSFAIPVSRCTVTLTGLTFLFSFVFSSFPFFL